MKSISNILMEVLGGVEPICTVPELSGVCSVTDRTVNNWKYGNTEPTFTQLRTLSHYLIQEYQYYILAFQFMLPCNGRANGSIQDDLMELYDIATDLHRAYRRGDKLAYEKALAKMKAKIDDFEAEGEIL